MGRKKEAPLKGNLFLWPEITRLDGDLTHSIGLSYRANLRKNVLQQLSDRGTLGIYRDIAVTETSLRLLIEIPFTALSTLGAGERLSGFADALRPFTITTTLHALHNLPLYVRFIWLFSNDMRDLRASNLISHFFK